MMIEAFTSILIVCVIGAGAYYAALQFVQLRHNRDTLADEYKRAEVYILELESRVQLLEADSIINKSPVHPTGESSGWDALESRRGSHICQ